MRVNGVNREFLNGFLSKYMNIAPQKGKPLETVLFSGGWKLKGNQLILNIRHDEFFDGRFGKLVFEGTDI